MKKELIGKGFNQYLAVVTIHDYNGPYYEPTRQSEEFRTAFEIRSVRYEKANDKYVLANGKEEAKFVYLPKKTIEKLIETYRVIETKFIPCHPNHKGQMGDYWLNDMALQGSALGKAYENANKG